MPNKPIENHRWLGRLATYLASHPNQWDGAMTPGLVVAPGMQVIVLAAFANWNDVHGLDMLYVRVPITGMTTHITPSDLGWSQPVSCDGLPLDQTTCPDRAGHM